MNFNTEQMLIGGLLLRPENFYAVAEIVSLDDFLSQKGRKAFEAISGKMTSGQAVNIVTCANVCNDPGWIAEATDIPGVASSAEFLAGEIAAAAKKKRINERLKAVTSTLASFGPQLALQEMRDVYQDEVAEQGKPCDVVSVVSRFEKVVEENKRRGRVGFDTGFRSLDRDYITYQQGHLWVVGAWTSTGKTAWAIEAIKRVYLGDNPHVALFSTEMTEEQNISRLLANVSAVSSNRILSGNAGPEECGHVEVNKRWLLSRNLHVFDNIRKVDKLANQCRKISSRSGLDLVFIDFIQNISKHGCSSKYEMMSEVAIELQSLAKELRCCIVCLSQIPTSSAKEDAGILEFKGAGEIAAAADIGVWLKKEKNREGVLLWETRKNRHGKLGKFLLQFVDGFTRLEEIL